MSNFFKWEMPTEDGDVIYFLLTQDGYENLLKPVEIDNLGNLSEEILLIKAASDESLELVNKLMQRVDDLEKELKTNKSEWDIFKDSLKFYSVSKFNSEYTEKELVTIANTRELLPDWLKSTKGKKADKVTWFQENKNEIDKY